MKQFLLICLFLIGYGASFSQNVKISGSVIDEKNAKPVIGATVTVMTASDSTLIKTGLTDSLGHFLAEGLYSGRFILTISSLGYQQYITMFSLDRGSRELPVASMFREDKNLPGVTIVAKPPLVTLNGDTVEYSAGRFKVNADANAEDLVKKMPGITVDKAGTVTAQGEQVKNVTVDGRKFFGDDATAALRNLPAEIIDKIQVFDRLSEQAQFTGFDDGSGAKSINIITKTANRNGQFGRVYGGYGTEDRYNAGGNVSFFKADRRISLVGLFNNINQQNFSSEDLLGVTASGGGRMGGGGNRGGGRNGGGGGNFGSGNNFLVGQQNGISTTSSTGINYSDKWGAKTDVSGSYFYNNSNTTNNQLSNTRYFIVDSMDQFYDETDQSSSINANHRFNFRLEHKIDTSNSIIFTPSLSYQENSSYNLTDGKRYFDLSRILDQTQVEKPSSTSGFNTNNNLLYRHGFRKRGRTISFNIGLGGNGKNGDVYLTSFNSSFPQPPIPARVDSVRQVTDQKVTGINYSANISYTEPVGKNGQLQFSYSPSFSKTSSDQLVNSYDSQNGKYEVFDSALSNKFISQVEAHSAGVNFRKGDRDNMFSIGFNVKYTSLNNNQDFPQAYSLSRPFTNILPNLMWRKKISASKSVNIFYRSSANVPSINQLQNVVDISNPLFLSTGNSSLNQQVNHTVSTRFTKTNAARGTSFFANLFLQVSEDYVSNAVYISRMDSVLDNGIILQRGSQLSKPINLDGYKSARLFLTEAFPVKPIKCNLNINAGINWSSMPGLINYEKTKTDNITWNGGLVLASNISEYIDFTISYNASFSNAISSNLETQNNKYINQTAGGQINLVSKKGWLFQNDISAQFYSGLSEGYNQNYCLWNMGVGKKILKNKSLEFKLSIFDLLNQNRSITRTVSETYIEDVQNIVLTRYFMFTCTYKLRNFGKAPSFQGRGGNPQMWQQGPPGMF